MLKTKSKIMNNNFKLILTLAINLLICLNYFAQKFNVSFSENTSKENFSGKVFLFLSKDNNEPKGGSPGMEPLALYSFSVKNIKPNETILFDDAALFYPVALSDIERGEYFVQAVWDKNSGGRAIGESPGNMFSKSVKIKLTKKNEEVFNLICSEINIERPFVETQFVKVIKFSSALLTSFYKRPTTIDAAIVLPKEYYDQPQRKFPVLFTISGYGGDYHGFSGREIKSTPIDTTPCINVFLDGNCPGGHSVYANSDNNGPWGDALTKELITEIDKKFRTNSARFLQGHSSGGWTVLWLQTQYPKLFTACWSSAPDPVDFRNFQQVDLYSDKNIFYATDGSFRMAATVAGRFPWVSMKNMYGAENIIWRGEQLHSFDFVFSTKNADGTPRSLCNAYTGEIDATTVEHWKKYDICLNVRTNWNELKADLDGKIRVSVGNSDNFLLNFAVRLMEDEMKKLNTKFIFVYYPGDHFTVQTPEYKSGGFQFLQNKYIEFLNSNVKK